MLIDLKEFRGPMGVIMEGKNLNFEEGDVMAEIKKLILSRAKNPEELKINETGWRIIEQ